MVRWLIGWPKGGDSKQLSFLKFQRRPLCCLVSVAISRSNAASIAGNGRARQLARHITSISQSIWNPAGEASLSSVAALCSLTLRRCRSRPRLPCLSDEGSRDLCSPLGSVTGAVDAVLPASFHCIEIFQKLWKRGNLATVPPRSTN